MQYRTGPLQHTPTVVKNLVIINALVLLVKYLFNGGFAGHDLDELLGLHYISSPQFKPWQLVTYMFMHGSFWHLLFNMIGLFMLGSPLEYRWGSKRFLTYYMICGIGAAVLNMGVQAYEFMELTKGLSASQIAQVKIEGLSGLYEAYERTGEIDSGMWSLASLLFTPMVGASGAVFGILVAFGMLYPNVELIIFPLPIPIKAKWFVILYGGYELFNGFANQAGDNVAHFAHIGGLIVGFVTVMIWKRRLPYT